MMENVISMHEHKANSRDRHLRNVEAYWRSLSKNGLVPLRSSIKPKEITAALPYTFVGEAVHPGVVRLRVSGMHLNDLMGMSVAGMPFSALFSSECRSKLEVATQQMFETSSVLDIACGHYGSTGGTSFEASLIVLPLRSEAGTVNKMLGCLETRGQIGPPPHRLAIRKIGFRPFQPTRTFAMPRVSRLTIAAENSVSFEGKVMPAPALKLVISND